MTPTGGEEEELTEMACGEEVTQTAMGALLGIPCEEWIRIARPYSEATRTTSDT